MTMLELRRVSKVYGQGTPECTRWLTSACRSMRA